MLVGRARHQAGALSGELRQLGAEVIEIPFIEIRKPRSFAPLDSALKNMAAYDWLILTSANGVEAMWARMEKLGLSALGPSGKEGWREHSRGVRVRDRHEREGHDFSRAVKRTPSSAALAAEENHLRVAAIGPATRKAIEQRGVKVDVVPKEYVAESVVRSLRRRVKGKRVLLVRAKVARDVIPRELRRAGARVDVVEAYETVMPEASRRNLRAALKNPLRRPHVITFTSSSTVRNFVALMGGSRAILNKPYAAGGRGRPRHTLLDGIHLASIGPVTSSTLREFGLSADIKAREYTIPGLSEAIRARLLDV